MDENINKSPIFIYNNSPLTDLVVRFELGFFLSFSLSLSLSSGWRQRRSKKANNEDNKQPGAKYHSETESSLESEFPFPEPPAQRKITRARIRTNSSFREILMQSIFYKYHRTRFFSTPPIIFCFVKFLALKSTKLQQLV